MDLNNWALYKVVEIEGGIAIINATMKSDQPDAVELIVGDASACMQYLGYYIYARAQGRTKAEAHKQAIAGVPHIRCWNPEAS